MDIFSAKSIHLTGIKGVAMTSLAQCLVDMGKMVTGSDVSEEFVTQSLLNKLSISISDFSQPLDLRSGNLDLLIYTAAHGGPLHPEVQLAKTNNIAVMSQAEALAQLFNKKTGVAVCGVGGKSTVSAMITWILEQTHQNPSFSVGVGNIIGLNKTGQWNEQSELFIAEADEYVIDPAEKPPVPRFSFLQPSMIICTNLRYDHPDVYQSFDETKQAFLKFFLHLKAGGVLIINDSDQHLVELTNSVKRQREDVKIYMFGKSSESALSIQHTDFSQGMSHASLAYTNRIFQLKLPLPGEFNLWNATAALLAVKKLGIHLHETVPTLASFQSTLRRFEFKGRKNEVMYYDDYAHHPSEITAVIQALQQWYPDQRRIIAFQPHTFSRTLALRSEFAQALSQADEVVLLDIFPSAREQFSNDITSNHLVEDIKKLKPTMNIQNLHTIDALVEFCLKNLQPNDVFITLGAGDIYKVHDKI